MSAIATVLAAMGHTVTGSDLRASPVTERLRPAGIPVAIGHRADNLGDADVVTASSAVDRGQPRAGRGPTARAHGAVPGRGAGRRGVAQALPSPWPAPTARRPPRRCWPSCWSRPGCDRRSSSAATSTRSGPTPCGTTATGWWSRPTRATARFLALDAGDRRGHQRRGRPPRPLRLLRRPAPGLRASSVPGPPTGWSAATTRSPPPSGGPAVPTSSARAPGAPTAWSDLDAGPQLGGLRPGRARTGSDPVRIWRCRYPAPTTPATPPWPRWPRVAAGGHDRRRGRGPGPLRRGGPPVRVPGRGRRGHLRRRLRPSARRGAGRAGRRPQRRAGDGWWPSSSPIATAGPPSWPPSSARPSPTPTWSWSPTSTRPARPRCPGCRASWWPTPSSAPSRTCPSTTCRPRRARRRRGRPPRAGRPVLHPGRRRPHRVARRAPGRARAVSGRGTPASTDLGAPGPGPRRAGPSGPARSAPSPPTGSGGPAALFAEPADEEELLAVARAYRRPAPGSPSWSWGGAPTCWWPTAASPGWPWPSGTGFEAIAIDGTDGGRPGAAVSLPVLARRTAAAGLSASSGRSACPARWAGAVRMNAGGHGSDTAATLVSFRWVDLASARAFDAPADAPGLRLPALLRRPDRGGGGRPLPARAGRPRGRCGRDRRDRAVAAGQNQPGGSATPDRCSPTRPATRPAGSSTAAGSRAIGSAPPRCRPSTPTSSRPTPTARPTTCAGSSSRCAARWPPPAASTLATEVRMVGFEPTPDGAGGARRARPMTGPTPGRGHRSAHPPAPASRSPRSQGRRRLRLGGRRPRGGGRGGHRASAVLHTPWFSARVVTVTGRPSPHHRRRPSWRRPGSSAILPSISVNPGPMAARVEPLPYIATAEVHRHWPDGVQIIA